METIYLLILILLAILAVSDLIVGVGNDAVNFLNSAIGSKTAPLWIILIVASVGVLIGAAFSNGMMEVARKGVFYPGEFVFSEIMIIFIAVMLTDVILLDIFNTFGFPTSTTVSLVFELLGAAIGITLIKLGAPDETRLISDFINSSKALGIIGGILSSVVIAFTAGIILQWVFRLIFTFNYEKTYKYFGSIWGALSITVLLYFIVIKGLQDSIFANISFIKSFELHPIKILLLSFLANVLILEFLKSVLKINILKIVVLVGTFGLAMSFAGNDLVNFIGVPLAGYSSYQAFIASGLAPDALSMDLLNDKVDTPFTFLLIAGVVMILTLWFSKKARTVTRTEVNLGRQEVGYERFGSTLVSRSLVRYFVNIDKKVQKYLPSKVSAWINSRFETIKTQQEGKDRPAFDMIRATVNLVISSLLIASATSLKLPLSTTYVTFMVAMGSSLADGAWGRESAVYRITGVMSVIGGWFITAIVAFTSAFLIAIIIHFGGFIAIGVLIALATFLIIKSNILHSKKEARIKIEENMALEETDTSITNKCAEIVSNVLTKMPVIYLDNINAFVKEDRSALKKVLQRSRNLHRETKFAKINMHNVIHELREELIDSGHYYVQVVDYLREISNSLVYITEPCFDHIDNNHETFNTAQQQELQEIGKNLALLITNGTKLVESRSAELMDSIINQQETTLSVIESARKRQIKRIKNNEIDTKNSLLFLNILSESKNMTLFMLRLIKAYKDFINSNLRYTNDTN